MSKLDVHVAVHAGNTTVSPGLGRSKKINLPKVGSFPRKKHQVWEVLISGTTLAVATAALTSGCSQLAVAIVVVCAVALLTKALKDRTMLATPSTKILLFRLIKVVHYDLESILRYLS
jgi:hypothetical protein